MNPFVETPSEKSRAAKGYGRKKKGVNGLKRELSHDTREQKRNINRECGSPHLDFRRNYAICDTCCATCTLCRPVEYDYSEWCRTL